MQTFNSTQAGNTVGVTVSHNVIEKAALLFWIDLNACNRKREACIARCNGGLSCISDCNRQPYIDKMPK